MGTLYRLLPATTVPTSRRDISNPNTLPLLVHSVCQKTVYFTAKGKILIESSQSYQGWNEVKSATQRSQAS